jgi:peroxiredoxin
MSLEGSTAPDFTLRNTVGAEVTLSETLDSGPSVVVTFRGTWCSFCAEQLQTFSNLAYDMHRHQGVDVLPVAGASVGDLAAMRDRYDLRIQLLADPDFEVSRAYAGVREHPDHGRHTRAGTFLVDPTGTVRYEHLADHSADRRYANFFRYLIDDDYEDEYFA